MSQGAARDPVAADARALRLAQILTLVQRARAATASELPYLLVNDTNELLPYRQALLWQTDGGTSKLVAASGVTEPDPRAPLNLDLRRCVERVAAGPQAETVHTVTLEGAESTRIVPAAALWVPLRVRGRRIGALLLLRDAPWSGADQQAAGLLADGYAHAWAASRLLDRSLARPRRHTRWRKLVGMALLIALFAWPVKQFSLAPATVVAAEPIPVRAPAEGIVAAIHVEPNAQVSAGDLLVSLEEAQILARLEVARRSVEIARTEHRQATARALVDAEAKARIALLDARVRQAEAELAAVEDLAGRTRIHAAQDGVALFSDANEWPGRPVQPGERILQLADPRRTELEIALAADDDLGFSTGAEVQLFLNTDPQHPVPGRVHHIGYRAEPAPDGLLRYRLLARLDGDRPYRIGLKGTAKIYAGQSPFILWALRRPLAWIKLWTAG